jgi:hypothetical protein
MVIFCGVVSAADATKICQKMGTIGNWYCHTGSSSGPAVASDTASHGSGYYCWCWTGSAWAYSGYNNNSGYSYPCALECPETCGV